MRTATALDILDDEPLWLLFAEEEDEDESDDDSETEEEEGESDEDDDSDDDEDDDEGEGEDSKKSKSKKKKDDDEENIESLLSALRKERTSRREAERQVKLLRKQTAAKSRTSQSKGKDATDDAAARRDAEELERKQEKLAASLRTQAEDRVIAKHARNLRFLDEDDAVRLLDRDDLDVEQDDDDPTKIKIDELSVKRAVRHLAKTRKHLVKPPESSSKKKDDEGDEEENTENGDEASKKAKSGSKFSKGKSKGKGLDEEKLKKLSPALAARRRGRTA